jgi:hypothetical protein
VSFALRLHAGHVLDIADHPVAPPSVVAVYPERVGAAPVVCGRRCLDVVVRTFARSCGGIGRTVQPFRVRWCRTPRHPTMQPLARRVQTDRRLGAARSGCRRDRRALR